MADENCLVTFRSGCHSTYIHSVLVPPIVFGGHDVPGDSRVHSQSKVGCVSANQHRVIQSGEPKALLNPPTQEGGEAMMG